MSDQILEAVYNEFKVPKAPRRGPALYFATGLLFNTLKRSVREIPIGTLLLVAANGIIFIKPGGVFRDEVALVPIKVIDNREVHRLWMSAFIHEDITQAMMNVTTLIEDGLTLEAKMGPVPFLVDVSMMMTLSHGIYVLTAWIEHRLGQSIDYCRGHLGFSNIGFALAMLKGELLQADEATNSDVPIPIAYHIWMQFGAILLVFPRSNPLAYIPGLLAGIIRVYMPRPFLWLRKNLTNMLGHVTDCRLDNREEDERKLRESRSKRRLWHHLALFCLSAAFQVIRLRRRIH